MHPTRLTTQLPHRRWAPFFALAIGALVFVALALLLIPSRFERAPPIVTATLASASAFVPHAVTSAAPLKSVGGTPTVRVATSEAAPQPRASAPPELDGPAQGMTSRAMSEQLVDRGDRPAAPEPR